MVARRHVAMQAGDVLPDLVVELEAAGFAQLHDAGCREALRMRGDAETMPRGQRHAREASAKP